VSDLSRLTLRLYQGCDAYLRYFRERSVRERRDLTRLGALIVGANDAERSRLFPPPLRRGSGRMIAGEPVVGRQGVCESSKRETPHGG
jgi:hypothetical protein